MIVSFAVRAGAPGSADLGALVRQTRITSKDFKSGLTTRNLGLTSATYSASTFALSTCVPLKTSRRSDADPSFARSPGVPLRVP